MSLRKIDLNLLVSLDALLRERNVTKAARRLGLSQPAVSAQLSRLRDLFEDPLLVPGPRGMLPTARAIALQPMLAERLAGIEALFAVETGFDPASAEATFRIAAPDSVQVVIGAPLVARLRLSAPRCRVALVLPVLGTIGRQMEEGEVDLMIGAAGALHPEWRSRKIYDEHFVCVVRADHPVVAAGLDLDRYCALDHLLVSPSGGGFLGVVDGSLGAIGRKRRVAASVQEFLVAPPLLAGTDLIATLPSRLAGGFGPGFRLLPPPLPIGGFSIRLAWHPRSHGDPALEWLREEIAALAAGLDPGPCAGGA